ncbi:MAG: anhydro-N-acetylmuramic acid kinase [Bacteroidales bacterium]
MVFAETIPYPEKWVDCLSNLIYSSETNIESTHIEYGKYLGLLVKDFIHKHKVSPDFISSHGHTVFHQPEKGFTLQIGSGQAISDLLNLPVVFDFRTLDVQLGGQGAPLVPIGDKLLFGDYAACLNFGGIANISYEREKKRIAFDICPFNMVLNHYARKLGFEYDDNGSLALSGRTHFELLKTLNELAYYHQEPPKSLGREWVEKFVIPLIDALNLPTADVLRTFADHIVFQLEEVLKGIQAGRILITGGGAKNSYIVNQLQAKMDSELVIPQELLVDYKEALVFAFLGVLRRRNEINCLSSVTGASRDSSSGAITGSS